MARQWWFIFGFTCIWSALSTDCIDLPGCSLLALKLRQSNVFTFNDFCKVHAFVRAEDLKSNYTSQGQLAVFSDGCIIDNVILELRYDESEDFATPVWNLTDVLTRKAPICNARSHDTMLSFLDPEQFAIGGQSTKLFSTDIALGKLYNANVTYDFTINTPNVFFPPTSDMLGAWGFVGNTRNGYERLSRDYIYVVHIEVNGKRMSQAVGRTTFVAPRSISVEEVEELADERYPVQCKYHISNGEQERLVTGKACY